MTTTSDQRCRYAASGAYDFFFCFAVFSVLVTCRTISHDISNCSPLTFHTLFLSHRMFVLPKILYVLLLFSMEYYMEKTYYKTASLISNSCKAVALLAGQTADVSNLAFEYGKNLVCIFSVVFLSFMYN